MSQGASPYPIAKAISALMDDYGFTPVELVHALGYRNGTNRARGLRRINLWLENGEGHNRILNQIAAVYPGHAEALQKALAETAAMKKAEAEAAWLARCKAEQDTFRPYLHAEGESRIPNGITLYGISGGKWNLIEIPKAILGLPLEKQLERLPKLMAAYRRRYKGDCPFFGKLTGFKFVRLLDYFRFDRDGQFVEHVEKPFRRGTCWVELR